MPVLTIVYGQPDDTAAFDRYYEAVHSPLAAKVPGVLAFTTRHCTAPDGDTAEQYLLAQLQFASDQDLTDALSSPEGQAAAADVANFATGGAQMFVQRDPIC